MAAAQDLPDTPPPHGHEEAPAVPYPAYTAAAQGLANCHMCGKISPVTLGRCPRCDSRLHLRKPASLARTWSLLAASAAFYVPANVLPIMTVGGFGGDESSTILTGVVNFWNTGSYPVAIIIFTASILIPILKVGALIWLCLSAHGVVTYSPRHLSKVYYLTELLGRWSMVDVFVVAILVCLVQLGAISTVTAGPAALSFALVVVLTMFAAMSFDPRLIWDRLGPGYQLPALPEQGPQKSPTTAEKPTAG